MSSVVYPAVAPNVAPAWRIPAAQPGAWPSLREIASSLGIPAAYLIDHGDFGSDPGSGQTMRDLTGNGRNFYLGADGTASSDDPTFRGIVGARAKGARLYDGSDRLTGIANGTFEDALHKANVSTTLWAFLQFPNFSSLAILWATARLTSDIGIRHIIGTSGQLSIGICAGSGFTAMIASSIVATANKPTFLAVSAANSTTHSVGHVRINDQVEAFNTAIPSFSSAAATRTMGIGGNDIGTQTFNSGTLLGAHGGASIAMSQGQTGQLYNMLKGRRL